jgi:putative ABC transport system permease protein
MLYAADEDAPDTPRTGERGRISIVVSSVKPEAENRGPVVAYGLTRNDYHRIVAAIPRIRRAIPIREVRRQARFGDRTAEVRLIGTTSEFAGVNALTITRGRFLAEKDVRRLNNVAVIGRDVARRLFPDSDPIGENVRIGSTYFLIVGESGPSPASKGDQVSGAPALPGLEVYVPLSTMRARLGDREVIRRAGSVEAEQLELSRIEILADRPQDVETIAQLIRRLLERYHEQPDYSVEVGKQGR